MVNTDSSDIVVFDRANSCVDLNLDFSSVSVNIDPDDSYIKFERCETICGFTFFILGFVAQVILIILIVRSL